MSAVQIVPSSGGEADGVGGFARALAQAGVGERLLVAEPGELARTLRSLGEAAILLHYANYGYQPRGCPGWLVDALERAPGRLVTLFHEVYATGPPWRSSFWLSSLQRRLAARLVRRSAAVVTSLTLYRDLIHRLAPGRDVLVLPVASTVGEPAVPPPTRERPARLVVFGGSGGRERVYRQAAALSALCERLSIEEVLDIGPSLSRVPARLGRATVQARGTLDGGAVSRELLTARAGIALHTPAFLAKSTVHAAYCAHAVAPIVLAPGPEASQLQAGVHYGTPELAPEALPDLAASAREWYRGHELRVQAARYAELLA
jgi:hypothetical protein